MSFRLTIYKQNLALDGVFGPPQAGYRSITND
jgi:hypothetical protein